MFISLQSLLEKKIIKIRKVIYNESGFIKGEYLGKFNGTSMEEAYIHLTELWMEYHTSNTSQLNSNVLDGDVDYLEEFTVCDEDYIFVGLPNTISYEVINDELYTGYYGCELDQYGFELMVDSKGNRIPYTSIKS